jgi:TRAP transporter TAXI family solute receptor
MDLASARDVKLLDLSADLEAMKKINPGYTLVSVPPNTYPKQDKEVKVIGYATHIVAACSLPADTVYAMTKAMAANVPSMAATNKAMEKLTPKDMAEDIGIPFHPGAARFYKEAVGLDVKTM